MTDMYKEYRRLVFISADVTHLTNIFSKHRERELF